MVGLRVLPGVACMVCGLFGVGHAVAMPLKDQIKAAIEICAPYTKASGTPKRAQVAPDPALLDAWSLRYGAPDPNFRGLQGLPLAVISEGVQGCWVFGMHEGHTEVVAAAKALAKSEQRLRVTDTYNYGISMDRSNAEAGLTLRSSGGGLGRVNVTVATYGPAESGYFEVNVSAR